MQGNIGEGFFTKLGGREFEFYCFKDLGKIDAAFAATTATAAVVYRLTF